MDERSAGPSGRGPGRDADTLSPRQQMVLRAVVAAYVADASPASSATVSHLLPVGLSSASIRNTMAELASLGLLDKPHASAGRVPTERGLRAFLDRLLDVSDLAAYERRALQSDIEEASIDSVMHVVSQLLSDRTHQLGFVMTPRLSRLLLRHISLVRVASDKLMVILVPQAGPVQHKVIQEEGQADQAELDRMAALLNERIIGRTIEEVRRQLEGELRELLSRANRLLARTLSLGLRVLSLTDHLSGDLVIASRLALLSQPEFNDPDRIRGLLSAVETNERLLDVLSRVLEGEADGVSISLGEDLEEPALRQCAVVAVPYGARTREREGAKVARARHPGLAPGPGSADGEGESILAQRGAPLGVIGVIGPNRMDYARIIPLVSYCSQLVTEKLNS